MPHETAVRQLLPPPPRPLITTSGSSATATWGSWNIQFVQTTGAANVYQPVSATANAWVLWNKQAVHDFQKAVATASQAMESFGHTVVNSADAMTKSWAVWSQQFITMVTSSASTINVVDPSWDHWNQQLRNASPQQVRQAVNRARPTEEEVRAAQERERRYREEDENRRREETEAKAKAELLLRRHLSPEQVEDLEKKGCFYLLVRDEKYQIVRGQHGNVKLLDRDGQVRRSFCIHPRTKVPDADAMLAQKLLLESDKDSFYRIANVTEYGGRGETLRPVVG